MKHVACMYAFFPLILSFCICLQNAHTWFSSIGVFCLLLFPLLCSQLLVVKRWMSCTLRTWPYSSYHHRPHPHHQSGLLSSCCSRDLGLCLALCDLTPPYLAQYAPFGHTSATTSPITCRSSLILCNLYLFRPYLDCSSLLTLVIPMICIIDPHSVTYISKNL